MRERRFHVSALAFVVLGLSLYLSGLPETTYVKSAVNLANTLIMPVLKFKESSVKDLKENIHAYLDLVNVRKENIRLKRELEKLLLTEGELKACVRDLEKTLNLVRFTQKIERTNYSVSRIIYYDPSGLDRFVIIEGGKDRNFQEGDLVVVEGKILGFIEQVYGSTSRVVTVFNKKLSLPSYVLPEEKRFIYKGDFPLGKLLMVRKEDPLKEGTPVMFRLKGKLSPEFIIGEVIEVKRGDDPFFKEVKVKPSVDPRKEELVIVVKGR